MATTRRQTASRNVPQRPAPGMRTDVGGGKEFPQIPGYRITGRLGEGGMGDVWSGVQLTAKREVAVKLLSAAAFGHEADEVYICLCMDAVNREAQPPAKLGNTQGAGNRGGGR